MIESKEIDHCIKVLGEQIILNKDLAGTNNKNYYKLCEATGILKLLLTKLEKEDANRNKI